MGEPVKIMDLARDMIRFAQLEPGKDIAIEIVGARPGEKLHEELFNPYERPSRRPRPRSCAPCGLRSTLSWVEETFSQIGLLVLEGDAAALAAKVGELAAVRTPVAPVETATEAGAEPVADGAAIPSPTPEAAGGRVAS